MQKLFVACLLICASHFVKGQVIDDNNGKTFYYYDSLTHKKVKEIFHHKQVVIIKSDPKNRGEYLDTFVYVKNGPYLRYNEDGSLDCSGYYRDEKKDSLWKYYNTAGDLLRTERWKNGNQIQ